MPSRIGTIRYALLTLMLCLPLWACTDQPGRKPPTKTSLQLNWVHQGEYAGSYVAREMGIFTDFGLDVDIIPGGPDTDSVESLLKGKTDFGTLGAERLLLARQAGHPIVALCVLYQRSPVVFITLQNSGISKPDQFVRKKITFFDQNEDRVQFEAMMHRLGLNSHQAEVQPYNYKYQGLLDGKVDISGAYAIGGFLRLQNQGIKTNMIWPYDYGVRFYGSTLVTTEQFLQKNPDIAKRFVAAQLKGWQMTLENPAMAVDATMKYAKEKDHELQMAMIKAALPLVHSGENRPGGMNPKIWEAMNETLHKYGVLEDKEIWKTAIRTGYLPE